MVPLMLHPIRLDFKVGRKFTTSLKELDSVCDACTVALSLSLPLSNTHTHTHARMHAHTHTHVHAQAHTCSYQKKIKHTAHIRDAVLVFTE